MKKQHARVCFAVLARRAERLEREMQKLKARSTKLKSKVEQKSDELDELTQRACDLKHELRRRALRFKHPVITKEDLARQPKPRRA